MCLGGRSTCKSYLVSICYQESFDSDQIFTVIWLNIIRPKDTLKQIKARLISFIGIIVGDRTTNVISYNIGIFKTSMHKSGTRGSLCQKELEASCLCIKELTWHTFNSWLAGPLMSYTNEKRFRNLRIVSIHARLTYPHVEEWSASTLS